jgi:3'-phosphoadenosine 5'-phosphosulfate sulfotransferase (PAPS reductase)/FAD synthetase
MKYILILSTALIFTSCNWAKQKTKDTINKTGEVVAKTGSEFADGVQKGVVKSFENEVVVSESLKKEGFETGKITITSSDAGTDNVISAYVIFNDSINKNITVKVFDNEGKEYGRTSYKVIGKKNESKYIDIVFDSRTNIDGKGKVTFE